MSSATISLCRTCGKEWNAPMQEFTDHVNECRRQRARAPAQEAPGNRRRGGNSRRRGGNSRRRGGNSRRRGGNSRRRGAGHR